MATTKTLLKCEHGSHLYGLATDTSDFDYYTIFEYPWKIHRPSKQVSQIIKDDIDVTETSLGRFQDMCFKGIPQALETLFSPEESWIFYDDSWYDNREYIVSQLKSNKEIILDTYRRTTLNFFAKDNFKKNRHALRLLINVQELKDTGRFTPKLSIQQRDEITRIAVLPRNQRENIFKDCFFETFK